MRGRYVNLPKITFVFKMNSSNKGCEITWGSLQINISSHYFIMGHFFLACVQDKLEYKQILSLFLYTGEQYFIVKYQITKGIVIRQEDIPRYNMCINIYMPMCQLHIFKSDESKLALGGYIIIIVLVLLL